MAADPIIEELIYSASSLQEVAAANARLMFANVIRAFRRSGQAELARAMVRVAHERGTHPRPLRHA